MCLQWMPRGISVRWCRSTRARRVSLFSLPVLRSLIRHYNVYPSTVVYNVFNIDQTNMKEARPEIYEKIILENGGKKQEHKGEMFHFDAMDRMMEENRWICPIKQLHGDSAFYSISKKLIVLPEFSQFKDGESFYGTAFHEMAHSTGAEEHLNRLKPAAFGSAEYAQGADKCDGLPVLRYGQIHQGGQCALSQIMALFTSEGCTVHQDNPARCQKSIGYDYKGYRGLHQSGSSSCLIGFLSCS